MAGREYRYALGYRNQENLKRYFKAKDIVCINWELIEAYNLRLKDIFARIYDVTHLKARPENIDAFFERIDAVYYRMRQNDIVLRMNNYGRSPENVYFSWLRGLCVCDFFSCALARIFEVSVSDIRQIGLDNVEDIGHFQRAPIADLELNRSGRTVRLEIQSGFTGINDIKEHKVKEAKREFLEYGIISYVVHFDLFNGVVAIVDITQIAEDSINWEARQQLEGQRVFSIPDDRFKWQISEAPLTLEQFF